MLDQIAGPYPLPHKSADKISSARLFDGTTKDDFEDPLGYFVLGSGCMVLVRHGLELD